MERVSFPRLADGEPAQSAQRDQVAPNGQAIDALAVKGAEQLRHEDLQFLRRELHRLLVGNPSRRSVLTRYIDDAPSPAIRKAAEALLQQDRFEGVEDGIGGYQWMDGELRWGSGTNPRRLVGRSGLVYDLLPGSVQIPIASSSYTLHMCNGLLRDSNEDPAIGLCCGHEHRIFISNVYPAPNRIGTVWHEIMHACWFEMGHLLPDGKHSCETWCNVTEKAMGGITPQKYAEIIAFVTLDQFGYPADPASA